VIYSPDIGEIIFTGAGEEYDRTKEPFMIIK
jgi:hypothetical protein